MTITSDTNARHDCLCGGSNRALNDAKFGDGSVGGHAPNARDLLALGGAKYIKALRAPFPHIEMVPTGGVNLETTPDFLRAGACAVGVGAELIDAANIRAGNYDVFEERARKFLEVVRKTRAEMKAAV